MKTKKIIILSLFILSVFILNNVYAQAIPLNDLELKIEQKHLNNPNEPPLTKHVKVGKTKRTLRAFWYSMAKELSEDSYYHTYKIKANKGILETDNFNSKRSLLLPSMWGDGYIRSETALGFWLDPEFLDLSGKKRIPFNVGFINPNKYLLRAAPDSIFDKITYFQNLYEQYVVDHKIRADVNISKSHAKELKKFIKEFFNARKIAKTKAKLNVNNVEESYPALIIGNHYYHLTVIDDPLNPLVINFKVLADNAPKLFEQQFKEMKKLFEFSVAEVTY